MNKKFDPQEAQIERIAQSLEEAIKNNKAPWRKEWDTKSSIAHNPYTGTIYSGSNPACLALLSSLSNYETNAWLTFNNVKELGGKVKKGAKAFPVTFYGVRKPTEEEVKKYIEEYEKMGKTLTPQEIQAYREFEKGYTRVFSVFNLDDVEIDLEILKKHQQEKGIDNLLEAKFKEKEKEFTPIKSVEEIIKNSQITFNTNHQGRAFYSPMRDIISLPPKYTFKDELSYYATALHELGHATGHESRLNRKIKGKNEKDEYAQEELRAEIFSFMQGEKLGLSFDYDNHISYLESYQKISKEGIKEAVKDVFKMNHYVSKNWYPKLEKEQEQNKEQKQSQEVKKEAKLSPQRKAELEKKTGRRR